MKKILPFIIVAILLFPNINGNIKGMKNMEGNNSFHLHGMNEMAFKSIPFNFHNIFSFIFSVLFSNFKEKINSWRNTANLNDEELDREQEYSDSSFKIYGSYHAIRYLLSNHSSKMTGEDIFSEINKTKNTFFNEVKYPVICWEVRYIDGRTILYSPEGKPIGEGIPAPSEKAFCMNGFCSDIPRRIQVLENECTKLV